MCQMIEAKPWSLHLHPEIHYTKNDRLEIVSPFNYVNFGVSMLNFGGGVSDCICSQTKKLPAWTDQPRNTRNAWH